MPIARHIKGGAVVFHDGGSRVVTGPGYIGPVPQRIIDKYAKQGRFEVIDDLGFPRVTADVKQGEAVQRQSEEPKAAVPGRFLQRHRGRGVWAIVDLQGGEKQVTIHPRTGDPMPEGMTKGEATALAEELNKSG